LKKISTDQLNACKRESQVVSPHWGCSKFPTHIEMLRLKLVQNELRKCQDLLTRTEKRHKELQQEVN
jgi:hypothetical protein